MRDVREDFPILQRRIGDRPVVYLDSAATSLKPQGVIDAVSGFYTQSTANIHRAIHRFAEEATEQFEDSRRVLARMLNAEAHEIVFTRGTTESINLVRSCFPGLERTLTTAVEHHSNLLPWGFGAGGRIVAVDSGGTVDMAAFEAALAPGVDLVAVSHVSNVLGTIQPLEELIAMAHAAGALVLVDAAQSAPHMPLDVRSLDVDFLACSAHKMLGPGGVGCLYAKAELLERMRPWFLGGNMVDQVHLDGYSLQALPHRLEAGTPAIEAVIGWGAALRYLAGLGLEEVQAHDQALVRYGRERLAAIDAVRVAGPEDPARVCSTLPFHVEGLEAHGVARMLNNRANIMVRSGFHCAQPLHESLNLTPTVRASFYVYNTEQDVDALAETLEAIVAFL